MRFVFRDCKQISSDLETKYAKMVCYSSRIKDENPSHAAKAGSVSQRATPLPQTQNTPQETAYQ